MRLIILIYLELGRFSKNGRSPIFRFYVSLFPISDSDPILTVAEIALGFCSQQRVPGSVCCHPAAFAAHHSVGGSARLITSACRYTDNSASTSDAVDAGTGAPSIWRRARPMGQRVPSSLTAAVVCWRADLTARIAPRRLHTA